MDIVCQKCAKQIHLKQPYPYHAGFGNEGFLYCDRDATVVTFSSYDSYYTTLVGQQHPWMLKLSDQEKIERALKSCPCGGRFRFNSCVKCPECGGILKSGIKKDIYYLVLHRAIDASKGKLWKASAD